MTSAESNHLARRVANTTYERCLSNAHELL